MTPLLTMAEAQQRLLATVLPLPSENLAVEQAAGRWLATPLGAVRTQPAADLSAMDGYAVRDGDLAGPWRVVGESAAGHPWLGSVGHGEAVRIATGALIPNGSGAVVVQEDCHRDGARVSLTGRGPHPADAHIRRSGLDFTVGAPLLAKGMRMGPVQIALAIAGGHGTVDVHRLPRVAIIDSGDELSPPGMICPDHQIPASNGAMLAAMVAMLGCPVTRIGPVRDDLDALVGALDGASGANVIVTSGGASVGDHDLIRPALSRWGATIEFWRVAMRPGKPLMHARRGHTQILGLPGNPVSSLVGAHFFLLPILRALAGAADVLPRRVMTRIAAPLPAGGERQEFLRGVWDGEMVIPNPMRDSSALAALSASNCLIDRPIGASASREGDIVAIYPLDGHGVA